MSKKNKFSPNEGTTVTDTATDATTNTATDTATTDAATTGEPINATPKPPKATRYIQNIDGTKFKIIPYPLPKAAQKEGVTPNHFILIDGQEVPVFVTTSKGWSTPETALKIGRAHV